jgi:hypothetical protein
MGYGSGKSGTAYLERSQGLFIDKYIVVAESLNFYKWYIHFFEYLQRGLNHGRQAFDALHDIFLRCIAEVQP